MEELLQKRSVERRRNQRQSSKSNLATSTNSSDVKFERFRFFFDSTLLGRNFNGRSSACSGFPPFNLFSTCSSSGIQIFFALTSGGDLHSSAPTPVDSSVLRKKDQEIERLKSEQEWMVTALQNAKKRGFQFDGPGTDGEEEKFRSLDGEGGDEEKRELIEMLLALKSELAQTKVSPCSTHF